MQTKAGIRELKAHLSAYLRQVKAGGTVVITDRGEPIGRIVPIAQPRACGRVEPPGCGFGVASLSP
jgi:prevent-host-death family protein